MAEAITFRESNLNLFLNESNWDEQELDTRRPVLVLC